MTVRRLLLGAALAAAVASTAAPPAWAQCDTRFVLRNASGMQVNEFYFGHSSNPNWGADQLGADVLPNGASRRWSAARAGQHDFKVVWSNGQHAELMRVDICSASEIVATRGGLEAR